MTARDRWEARAALALLPIGAAMTLISVMAFFTVALLAIDTVMHRPAAAGGLLAWCLAALAVAMRNTIRSIEAMSSFAWRPMADVALLSGVIASSYPGWWIGG